MTSDAVREYRDRLAKIDLIVSCVDSLDWEDYDGLIDWLKGLIPLGWQDIFLEDRQNIVATFAKNGSPGFTDAAHAPDTNTPSEIDRDELAHFVIGLGVQSLLSYRTFVEILFASYSEIWDVHFRGHQA